MDTRLPEVTPSPAGFPIAGKVGATGRHTLTLGDDFLEIRPRRGPAVTVPRGRRVELVTLRRGLFGLGGAVLTVRTPKILAFSLSPEAAAAYEVWRGPLGRADLRKALRSGFIWALVVGVVFLLAGVPLPADLDIGEEARPADAAALALGGGILAVGAIRFLWTNRVVFLLDLLWFAALAVYIVVDVAREGRSIWWLVLLPLFLVTAKDLLQSFRRFSPAE